MPRYFFHLRDSEGSVIDEEGLELSDDWAALEEGEKSAREILGHDVRFRIALNGRRLDVVGPSGSTLKTFRLIDFSH